MIQPRPNLRLVQQGWDAEEEQAASVAFQRRQRRSWTRNLAIARHRRARRWREWGKQMLCFALGALFSMLILFDSIGEMLP